jgi:hypothetical protein
MAHGRLLVQGGFSDCGNIQVSRYAILCYAILLCYVTLCYTVVVWNQLLLLWIAYLLTLAFTLTLVYVCMYVFMYLT